MIRVLYSDKYLLFYNKPIGIPSQPDRAGSSENVFDILSAEYPYVGLVHRLDAATGGVMLFSLDKSCTGKLCSLVGDHENFVKEYIAVSEGLPIGFVDNGETFDMVDELYHDQLKNKSFVVDRKRAGSKTAHLCCRLLATEADINGTQAALWLIRLYTGRTHQIRVQFASRGACLFGDGKYGGRNKCVTTALWSYRARLTHPVTHKIVSAISLPDFHAYPWSLFDKSIYSAIRDL